MSEIEKLARSVGWSEIDNCDPNTYLVQCVKECYRLREIVIYLESEINRLEGGHSE
jgi:hypothetical protein